MGRAGEVWGADGVGKYRAELCILQQTSSSMGIMLKPHTSERKASYPSPRTAQLTYGTQMISKAVTNAPERVNPLPAPGNLRFQNVGSCLGVLARIPSINFRFQGLTCGFFECIPENRAPTAPHVGDRP